MKRQAAEPSSAEKKEPEDYHFFGDYLKTYESHGKANHSSRVGAVGKALPVWKQEVTDRQGRKRFHGAFEGGWSAGYWNTVGSAEGWEPATFKSSRDDRTKAQTQSIEQFLDDDELEEYNRTTLETRAQYDTFGRAAKEEESQRMEQQESGSIPLLVPDIMITPVSEGVGVRLLLRMGWRQGKGLEAKDEQEAQRLMQGATSLQDIQHLKGLLRVENVSVRKIEAKSDTFGLGYDPFQGAEEFRHAKQRGEQSAQQSGRGRRGRGVAFGTGVLDEDDALGTMEDYVSTDAMHQVEGIGGLDASGMPLSRHQGLLREKLGDTLALEGYSFEVQDDDIDLESITGKHRAKAIEGKASLPLISHPSSERSRRECISGFVSSVESNERDILHPTFYPSPKIDSAYIPKTPTSLVQKSTLRHVWGDTPVEAPPIVPQGREKLLIDQVALQVARSGPEFENIASSKKSETEQYSFVLPENQYHKYYVWSVQKYFRMIHPEHLRSSIYKNKLDSEQRGAILGEESLTRIVSSSEDFSRQRQMQAMSKRPSLEDALKNIPEKDRKKFQERMASTFVKASEKESATHLKPGLTPGIPRQTQGTQESIQKPTTRKVVTVFDLSRPSSGTSVVPEDKITEAKKAASSGIPVRRVDEWIPEPLLCKRLGVENPFLNRKPTSDPVKTKFKSDELTLSANVTHNTEPEINPAHDDAVAAAQEFLDSLISDEPAATNGNQQGGSPIVAPDTMPSEKPLDLFQAIFEDTSSDEEEEKCDATEIIPTNLENAFKPSIDSSEHRPTMSPSTDFGFQKFHKEKSRHGRGRSRENAQQKPETDERHRLKAPSQDKHDDHHHHDEDDARIKEAIRIVKEAKERRRKKKRHSRHRSRSKERRSRHHKSRRHHH
ncbi:hypothetical protein M9435_001661 [Picochlorum sp. BPE23]|nr:hypothetical protein M9435_001661 [Picochlorum sp. BPE23]